MRKEKEILADTQTGKFGSVGVTARQTFTVAAEAYNEKRHIHKAESGLSDQTVMSIAGHVSREMMERHYSHIRLDATRRALESLESPLPVVTGAQPQPSTSTCLN